MGNVLDYLHETCISDDPHPFLVIRSLLGEYLLGLHICEYMNMNTDLDYLCNDNSMLWQGVCCPTLARLEVLCFEATLNSVLPQ